MAAEKGDIDAKIFYGFYMIKHGLFISNSEEDFFKAAL